MTMLTAERLDQIQREATKLEPAKVALTIIAFIPFLLGWIAGKTWTAISWTITAMKVGWQAARERERTRRPGGGVAT